MKVEVIEIPQSILFAVYGVDNEEDLKRAQEEEQKYWCKCHEDEEVEDEPDTYYVPDGKNKECTKHHWRCVRCDKITQIG